MKKIELGTKYRDTLHGIEGIATVQSIHLTGCDRICLEYLKDGEVKDIWVDITRLEGMETGDTPGGPGKVAPSRDVKG